MQSKLNLKFKFREGFRPFAPSVLAERAAEYFDVSAEAPYMTFVFPVRAERRVQPAGTATGLDRVRERRSDIPAVTHIDYSARVQTVSAKNDQSFHTLISRFGRMTGCDVLVNTSFNVRGEPIVRSPEDAIGCFRSHAAGCACDRSVYRAQARAGLTTVDVRAR